MIGPPPMFRGSCCYLGDAVMHPLMDIVESEYRKPTTPGFRIGDTVTVHVKIIEGEKERVQAFNGVVIARKGRGLTETFVVRRIVANEGVERTFLVHSPMVTGIEVVRSGKVRRAKLYYLRGRVGKARKLREARTKRQGGSKDRASEDEESTAVAAAD